LDQLLPQGLELAILVDDPLQIHLPLIADDSGELLLRLGYGRLPCLFELDQLLLRLQVLLSVLICYLYVVGGQLILDDELLGSHGGALAQDHAWDRRALL
jgi:hypothetical protein